MSFEDFIFYKTRTSERERDTAGFTLTAVSFLKNFLKREDDQKVVYIKQPFYISRLYCIYKIIKANSLYRTKKAVVP
jgi:hypothetical protein